MNASSLRKSLPSALITLALVCAAPVLMAPDEPPCGEDCIIEVVDAWRIEEQVTLALTNHRLEERAIVELYAGRALVDHAELALPLGRTDEVELVAPARSNAELAIYLPQIDHWLVPREDEPRRGGSRR